MNYALIYNDQIKVGPRDWNYYFFLDWLEENNQDFSQLPRAEPGIAVITDSWKLLPVTEIIYPEVQEPFEQLVGPFWTIQEKSITGLYTKINQKIDTIRGRLKETVAANRYAVEVGKLEYTFSDGETVELFTEREERAIYFQTLSILPNDQTVPFKFKGGKIRPAVTKAELGEIVALGTTHIRNVFEWESQKATEIDSASTIEDLKVIELRHPSQIS